MSFQREHGILVASPAAYDEPPPTSEWMIESCRRQGIELTLVGRGRPYPNHRVKLQLVAEYLRDHPEYRYVLQVDLRDVLFCATLRELFGKYRAIGHDIVISTERNCWPMASHAPLCPETGTTNRFVNSGAIFATAGGWLSAWDLMIRKERRMGGQPPEFSRRGRHIFSSDQAAWSDLYVHKEADIALDARCDLFQTLCHVDFKIGAANRDLKFEGNRIVNRETGARPCLVHCNSRVPIEPWARYVLEPPVTWAWPLIDRIRSEPRPALRDATHVELLLMDLGLHGPVDDDVPDDLLPFSGKGLAIRRRPSEYAALLAWLADRPPIGSYAEVGVGNGGAFIATVEYLRRFHPMELALGVGPGLPAVLLDYVSRDRRAHHVRDGRAADGLRGIAERGGYVDFTLIEAGRTDGNAREDWGFAQSCSRYVAIHGISKDEPAGAASLWEEIRATHRRIFEFVDRRLAPESAAGLGVVDLAYGEE